MVYEEKLSNASAILSVMGRPNDGIKGAELYVWLGMKVVSCNSLVELYCFKKYITLRVAINYLFVFILKYLKSPFFAGCEQCHEDAECVVSPATGLPQCVCR